MNAQSPKEFVDTHTLGEWNPQEAQTESDKLTNPFYRRAQNIVGALAYGSSRMAAEHGSEEDIKALDNGISTDDLKGLFVPVSSHVRLGSRIISGNANDKGYNA